MPTGLVRILDPAILHREDMAKSWFPRMIHTYVQRRHTHTHTHKQLLTSADPKISPRLLASDLSDAAIDSPSARAVSFCFSAALACCSLHLGSMSWMRMWSDRSEAATVAPVMGSITMVGSAVVAPEATPGL